jgi:hypothetical protein
MDAIPRSFVVKLIKIKEKLELPNETIAAQEIIKNFKLFDREVVKNAQLYIEYINKIN